MEVINVEIFSIAILFVLLSDFLFKFRNYVTKTSYVWFVLVCSVIIQSISSIAIYDIKNLYGDLFFAALYLFANAISALAIYTYIINRYIDSETKMIDTIKKCGIYLLIYVAILTIYLIYFAKNSFNESVRVSSLNVLTSLNLVPLLLSFITYTYHQIKTKKKFKFILLISLLLAITGTCIDIYISDIYFLSASYTLLSLIFYLQKHDVIMNTDPLTGLLNKKALSEFIQQVKIKSTMAVLNIDINDFKMINDTYGHEKGDDLLKDIATLLIQSTREADYVFRNGGDEFLIIANIRNESECKSIVDRLKSNLKEYNKNKEIEISISIGSGIYKVNQDYVQSNFVKFLKQVDEKMYVEKQKHKAKLK